MRNESGVSVISAGRALTLVQYVAERGSVSFLEVIRDLSLPRSSASGLLSTLTALGWISHDELSKRYRLGLRAWQVGQMYAGHRDLANLAKPVMDQLCEELGETVQLARLDGVENVYIAISESSKPMRLASSVGMRLHAHATGIGKVLLGMIDPLEARRRLESVTLPQLTKNTVTDIDLLMGLVDEARQRGFGTDDEEFVSGCRCVAVPLTVDRDKEVVTAISVTMPTSRTTKEWPQDVLVPLQQAAERLRRLVAPQRASEEVA